MNGMEKVKLYSTKIEWPKHLFLSLNRFNLLYHYVGNGINAEQIIDVQISSGLRIWACNKLPRSLVVAWYAHYTYTLRCNTRQQHSFSSGHIHSNKIISNPFKESDSLHVMNGKVKIYPFSQIYILTQNKPP